MQFSSLPLSNQQIVALKANSLPALRDLNPAKTDLVKIAISQHDYLFGSVKFERLTYY